MSARTLPSLLLLLAGLGVSLGLIAFHEPEDADVPNTEVERIDRPVDSGQDIEGGYHTLATGGPMYAGTVLSVTVATSSSRTSPSAPLVRTVWRIWSTVVNRVSDTARYSL